ncbi:pyrroline-5-carboxylate reductase [Cephaloticoccus capnophilus]|uniref:Pyrroline-5-carboxylate reductase n=1 Tax=Cephaloticoccus capnophilus TaxID=1548208 RepID=A0A139SHG5_9BACT|nr:pyrroline-5-carboxylate reductase [Cephaloticoccus capnophilus]KXU34022.1 pyrroline-5-carboxylate reductase [Cephaloticoccus capnophilus]
MSVIAFLGAGNMAAAMVGGLLKNGHAHAALRCYTESGQSARALSALTGITRAESIPALLAGADLLVVAFKPQHLATRDAALVEASSGKLIVSVMVGKTLAQLQSAFPHARAWVRAMPNTPGKIGAGVTGWCAHTTLADADRALVDSLLSPLGLALEVTEAQINDIAAISGSGPAYFFEFAAALSAAAQQIGFEPEVAKRLVTQTLLGSAQLLAQSGAAPETLRNQVTSPNGTTLAGLRKMEEARLRETVLATVRAAQARGLEIARES